MTVFPASKRKIGVTPMKNLGGCQLPCIPKFETRPYLHPAGSVYLAFKHTFAYPWNYYIKKLIKKLYYYVETLRVSSTRKDAVKVFIPVVSFKKGDIVKVRSFGEIKSTLNPFGELKGCAFLAQMRQYCGTQQRVFKSMNYFLDERDYKVKKTRGLVLLENVFCNGTPVFGTCDRSCFLFWREEWLEKI